MNIGIYGGTFNPPHLGHLILAQSAIDALDLDHVLLVPAFQSPFKRLSESLSAELRAEMVELAVSDNPRIRGEYHEVLRKEVSYTIDTLRHIRESHPDDTLFLLMGADTFNEFHLWNDPAEIVSLATLAVADRPGNALDLSAHPYGKAARRFSMPLIDISSTDIRRRIRENQSINYLVPWAVSVFIHSQGFYREP
ncbi:MAG: nicotinate (nicotinamide) nucleotide adenylyltransferase [Ignavibacteria bacterium]|nr:MAG: nicotinate (nicotinamide) nucleotide adenylyltransferase [Ignavibacteria bacterium]